MINFDPSKKVNEVSQKLKLLTAIKVYPKMTSRQELKEVLGCNWAKVEILIRNLNEGYLIAEDDNNNLCFLSGENRSKVIETVKARLRKWNKRLEEHNEGR